MEIYKKNSDSFSDEDLDEDLDESEDESEDESTDESEYESEDDLNELIEKLKKQINLDNNPFENNNIVIEFNDDKNLEQIQEEYYKKINNLNNKVSVTFIIPENLIKTKVFTFYKCWKNGYCLNSSTTKIPKNITKVLFKKK